LHTHKIASSPNDLAAMDIVEIIECKFEIQGQDIEVLQLNPCAALRYIADVASENAALLVEKKQRIPGYFRPGNCSLVDHNASGCVIAQSFRLSRRGHDLHSTID
jgi:hypothetical protein